MIQSAPGKLAFIWTAIKGTIAQISESNLGLVSAGVAFFAMLSLFPALAAVIAVMGLIADPVVVVAQLEEMREFLPNDVYEIINTQVVSLVTASADTLGWAGLVSLLVALWSARAGVGAIMIGLNSVYNERNRNTGWHFVRAMVLTIGLVGVGIVSLLTLVVAPIVLSFFPFGPSGKLVAEFVRWAIAVCVLFAGIGMLYRYGPNRKPVRAGWLTPGAVLAVVSWALVSLAFSHYVANFSNYNQVYGSIGAVIAMLIWLWISSFFVLLGAALNAQLEKRTGVGTSEAKSSHVDERGILATDQIIAADEDV
ncbi:ribonuclease BN [Sulfitobacter sp. SK012]|nr:YihY/virulence factor BrkB family protein [Sulfitobacter sp. SK012]AXI48341.1 ribonuclease BN [Sulfitobacter sp. SK012]